MDNVCGAMVVVGGMCRGIVRCRGLCVCVWRGASSIPLFSRVGVALPMLWVVVAPSSPSPPPLLVMPVVVVFTHICVVGVHVMVFEYTQW